jgi:hypothetical protein
MRRLGVLGRSPRPGVLGALETQDSMAHDGLLKRGDAHGSAHYLPRATRPRANESGRLHGAGPE